MSRRRLHSARLGLAAGLAGLALAAAGGAAAAPAAHTLRHDVPVVGKEKVTVYAALAKTEFLNNADDRRRAIINNPFTTNTKKLMTVMKGNEKQTGPLPGDTALFSFNLYKASDLKQQTGSAVVECQYNFYGKSLCQGYYVIGKGMMLGTGPVSWTDFNGRQYGLVVRGGTQDFLGARGQLTVTPVGNHAARRLDFAII
jgi:hypothetical protein